MRIIGLSLVFLSALLFFTKKDAPKKIDIIKVKASAPKRVKSILPEPAQVEEEPGPIAIVDEVIPNEEILEEDEEELSSTDEEEPSEELETLEVSEDQPAEEWKEELKSTLFALEPEKGEEIYESFLKEKSKFQDRMEELLTSGDKDALPGKIEELQAKHETKIKKILGPHYQDLKSTWDASETLR